ncbi:MAG: TetR/AcrR family transcriptional regulator [Oxalobacteraceae bacterium]|nr:MAG: TetR/AcrR family transcriptional regulator [Oxalobacteraceae bacterium]
MSTSEAILVAARDSMQANGFGGLNFRDLAADVGIKAASIYHHFPSKADLAAAVAKRYWEDAVARLDDVLTTASDPAEALHRYPGVFRQSLERQNRLCLGSFMSAEYDGLPAPVINEVHTFAEVNMVWLAKRLVDAGIVGPAESEDRARAIFAAVSGAQLMARSRSDIVLFDTLIASYRKAGLLPA